MQHALKTIEKDTTLCAVCNQEVVESSPIALFPKCPHKLAHLRCLDIVTDTTRRWSCPLCPLNQIHDDHMLAQWSRPRAGRFARTFFDEGAFQDITENDVERCNSVPVIVAIEKSMPAAAIRKSFDKRKDTGGVGLHIDTVGKWILHALDVDAKKTPAKRASLLEKLRKHGYTARDLLSFGITFEMVAGDSENHALMLDRAFFEPGIVARAPMSASFTKIMLAGIDIGLFAGAGFTDMDLNNLHFSIRGFIAAGGTLAELSTLRTRIKDTTLCNVFSFTSFMEECLRNIPVSASAASSSSTAHGAPAAAAPAPAPAPTPAPAPAPDPADIALVMQYP